MATFKESFCEAEEAAMRFLVDDHGFRAVERRVTDDGTNATVGVVRYEAQSSTPSPGIPPGWAAILSLAPFRLELDLEISNGSKAAYSVAELYELEGHDVFPNRECDLYEAAQSPNALRTEFERLAAVLRASGRRFFDGDMTLWSDLDVQRRRAVQAADDQRVLARSESAFQTKDWALVVRLLEPLSDRLNRAAAARLSYSKKKAQGAT